MSLLFYGYGELKFVMIFVGSIVFNHIMAILIDWMRSKPAMAKTLMIVCVTGNLSLLFVFKYFNFFIANLDRVGIRLPAAQIVLPLGISFFTFQGMSYVIDVYRNTAAVQKNIVNTALFVSFFPQLIAGPIVRYQTIAAQIQQRVCTVDDFSLGVHRFIIGFTKKILLANQMALVADHAFAMHPSELSVTYAWMGIFAYSLQILFDFSGYSDMAIGLGKMFGFHLLENFDYPYIARSVSEFWRRWHISLGQWFRDYVYFPLGGSRVKTRKRLLLNLFVVWSLTGIWHGANWNFLLWGLFYFALIAFEKLSGYPDRFKSQAGIQLYRIWTLLCVMVGWILFRANGVRMALRYVLVLFGIAGNGLVSADTLYALREHWLFFLMAVLCATPVFQLIKARVDTKRVWKQLAGGSSVVFYLFVFLWAVSYIFLGAHDPFIYFNF